MLRLKSLTGQDFLRPIAFLIHSTSGNETFQTAVMNKILLEKRTSFSFFHTRNEILQLNVHQFYHINKHLLNMSITYKSLPRKNKSLFTFSERNLLTLLAQVHMKFTLNRLPCFV